MTNTYRSASTGVKALTVAVWAIIPVSLFFLLRWVQQSMHIDLSTEQGMQTFRLQLKALGYWMPLAYCGIYSLRALIYIPEWLLMTSAGLLAGPFMGTALIVTGSLCATSLGYGVGRAAQYFGKVTWIEPLIRQRFSRVSSLLDKYSFRTLFVLRILPGFPFMLVTYSASLMKIPFGRFTAAMALGVVLPAFFYSFLGQSIWVAVHTWILK